MNVSTAINFSCKRRKKFSHKFPQHHRHREPSAVHLWMAIMRTCEISGIKFSFIGHTKCDFFPWETSGTSIEPPELGSTCDKWPFGYLYDLWWTMCDLLGQELALFFMPQESVTKPFFFNAHLLYLRGKFYFWFRFLNSFPILFVFKSRRFFLDNSPSFFCFISHLKTIVAFSTFPSHSH